MRTGGPNPGRRYYRGEDELVVVDGGTSKERLAETARLRHAGYDKLYSKRLPDGLRARLVRLAPGAHALADLGLSEGEWEWLDTYTQWGGGQVKRPPAATLYDVRLPGDILVPRGLDPTLLR